MKRNLHDNTEQLQNSRLGDWVGKRVAVISIGSNLAGPFGPPLSSCRRAVAELAALPFLGGCTTSDWYDTEPVPKSMQPNFVNGVATFAVEPDLDPVLLLLAVQQIETHGGRIRAEPNAPRTLDLDLVAIGEVVRNASDPILPHPRMHLRRFVLEPLRDVLPDWRHPRSGENIDTLLAALAPSGARRLAVDRSHG